MDVIKLRSYWIWVEPKSNDWYLNERERHGYGNTRWGGPCVKLDSEIGMIQL